MKVRVVFIALIFLVAQIYPYEELLIDFNNLKDTMIDFSEVAGDVYTPDQKAMMKMDLSINNWLIRVNESSWTKAAREKTWVKAVNNSLNYPGQDVLGVRVFFPERGANSYVTIKPPFLIPLYYDNKEDPDGFGNMFLNKGIVRNVGVIRRVAVRFCGNNFRYSLYVSLEDNYGMKKDVFIGYLDFVGWKTKSWINPNIDNELKVRQLKYDRRPYYPDEMPSVRFVGFIIQRTHPELTGNFTTMIKDVSLEYDEAFLEVGNAEYKQEEIFNIYKDELIERAKVEMREVDRRIFLQWQENQRKHKEPGEEKTTENNTNNTNP